MVENSQRETTSPQLTKKKVSKLPKGTILVPVDLYSHSEAPVNFASKLAKCMDAPLVMLHVVHDPIDAPGFYSERRKQKGINRMEDIAKDMLDQYVENIIKNHPNNSAIKNAERMIVVGIPITRILEIVEKIKPVMIVMGSQGRTGLAHAFLGSTAENIARMSPVPVTIVKSTANKKA